jgi:5'-AMP-activated protein kinase catalytic alpha subunit
MSSAKVVGRYRLLKTLGEGAFSKVKLGQHIDTGKTYAIKVIELREVKAQNMETQLRREIDVMSRMDHPSLIKLHEVMNSPRNIFLVLDLAAGGELFNKLAQDGALAEPVARNYFQQLIDALDYMHTLGAIHRDLKPENLLLDAEGRLKIADFGLSVFSGGGMLKTRCGTPNYVAPEIFHADGYSGAPADLWSAGVILFVMLAAELPFDAPSITDLARQIMAVRVTYPRTMPAGAVDLMKKLLVADPEGRLTIAQIRQHPWFAVNYQRIEGAASPARVIESNIVEGQASPAPAASAPGAATATEDDDGIDAFELIAAMGNLNMQRLVDQAAPVNNATSFTASKSKADIIKALTEVLEAIGVRKTAINPSKDGRSFKPEIPVGTATVHVRIEIRTITEQNSLIEVSRLKGQQFDYMRIYRTLRQRLAP